MMRNLAMFLGVVLLATPALAQRGGPGRMLDRVIERLELDDQQLLEAEPALIAARQQLAEMGEKWRALRQAEEAGDTALAETLRSELRGQGGPMGAMQTFIQGVEPVLREEQRVELNEMRSRMQERRVMRERYERIRNSMADELELSDVQRTDYENLMADYRDEIRTAWSNMRPLFEEMRAARENGDEALLEELRAEFEETRPDMNAFYESFMNDVAANLDAGQLERLEQIRAELSPEGIAAAGGEGGPMLQRQATPADERAARGHDGKEDWDLRKILRATRRLKLNPEQKEAIREIEREAMKALRVVRREGEEAEQVLAKQTKLEIDKLLDAEQKAEFDRLLEGRKRGGRPRPARVERGEGAEEAGRD